MKNALQIFLLSAVAVLTGCFNLESSHLGDESSRTFLLQSNDSKSAEHVIISNFGWYFFNKWPIACGNAHENRRTPWVFFRDDVDEDVIQSRLIKYATARECDVVDLHIFNNAEVLMSIGVGGVSLPLPYVFSYRELQLSCSLVKTDRASDAAQDAAKEDAAAPAGAAKDAKALKEDMRRLLDTIPDGGSK